MIGPSKRERRQSFASGSRLVLALLALLVLRLAHVGSMIPREVMMPGTQVAGIDLGGMSWEDARNALEMGMREQTLILRSDERSYETTPTALGLELLIDASLQAAFYLGRQPEGRLRSVIPFLSLRASPSFRVDPGLAGLQLREASASLDLAPVPATLRIESGRAAAFPGRDGLAIDVPAAITQLEAEADRVMQRAEFRPPMKTVPPLPSDASAAAAEANRLLVQPLKVEAYDPVSDANYRWEIAPRIWTRWLNLSLDPGRPDRPSWWVDAAMVAEGLEAATAALPADLLARPQDLAEGMATALLEEPPTLRIRGYHRPRQHRVEDGDTLAGIAARYGLPYPWIAEVNPEAEEGIWPGQILEIPPADLLIPLPPVPEKRLFVDLSDQQMVAIYQGRELWRWPVSTGVNDSPTAPGVYQVRSLEAEAYAPSWDLQMPFFVGIYPPMPDGDVMNGFHGFPTRGGRDLIWTDRIGAPATYGCVLLPSDRAEALYGWAELGVIVEIVP